MPRAPIPSEGFEPWEIDLIGHVVRDFLATLPHSPLLQEEDLVQEAQLHWWRQRRLYAPGRGASVKTFLRRVVKAKLLDRYREVYAEKRGGEQGALSLDMRLSDDDESTLGDTLADNRQSELLAQALLRVKAKLTNRQQDVVDALYDGDSKLEVARRLRVNRSTVYDDIARIRQVFCDEGLEDYLR